MLSFLVINEIDMKKGKLNSFFSLADLKIAIIASKALRNIHFNSDYSIIKP